MGFCWGEIGCFKDRSYKFIVESEHLVAQVAVVMIALGVSVELHGVRDHLLLSNRLERNKVRLIPIVMVVRLRVISRIVEEVRGMRPAHGGISSTI